MPTEKVPVDSDLWSDILKANSAHPGKTDELEFFGRVVSLFYTPARVDDFTNVLEMICRDPTCQSSDWLHTLGIGRKLLRKQVLNDPKIAPDLRRALDEVIDVFYHPTAAKSLVLMYASACLGDTDLEQLFGTRVCGLDHDQVKTAFVTRLKRLRRRPVQPENELQDMCNSLIGIATVVTDSWRLDQQAGIIRQLDSNELTSMARLSDLLGALSAFDHGLTLAATRGHTPLPTSRNDRQDPQRDPRPSGLWSNL